MLQHTKVQVTAHGIGSDVDGGIDGLLQLTRLVSRFFAQFSASFVVEASSQPILPDILPTMGQYEPILSFDLKERLHAAELPVGVFG